MSHNKTSDKLHFTELINRHKIEIPIIQRDYAQGREGKEELRRSFLDALHTAVTEEKPLELDFVYGTVAKNIVQPLDGQQRLTTLFLLHWYAATKERQAKDIKNSLTNFTYETRASSREFCLELVRQGVDLDRLMKPDKDHFNELSKTIIDSAWFFLFWKKDPTIKSMLVMLDDIHQRFKNEREIWTRLNNISFHYIELTNFGLSDDLYIKMNARGKEITEFEKFKASFERHLESKKTWEDGVHLEGRFEHKVDTIWTDLFWKHRDSENRIDFQFIQFISNAAIISYALFQRIAENEVEEKAARAILMAKVKGNVTDAAVQRERIERRIASLSTMVAKVVPQDFPDQQSFQILIKYLDVYSSKPDIRIKKEQLPLWDQDEDSTLFNTIILGKAPTYKQRVLFFAQTEYLRTTDYNEFIFSDWMRVVRNVVHNTAIDSADRFLGAVELVNELVPGCGNIYSHLATVTINSNFASEQMIEEVSKARLIAKDPALKSGIFACEDLSFFEGRIAFALQCASSPGTLTPESLSAIWKVVSMHLSEKDISNDFRRAMLTIRNNDFYTYWGTWSHGTDCQKRCLIENTAELKGYFTKGYKEYLKDMIHALLSKTPSQIVDEYNPPPSMKNWKKRLIKERELLDNYCKSKYFGIEIIDGQEERCFLFNEFKRPNSREKCFKVE